MSERYVGGNRYVFKRELARSVERVLEFHGGGTHDESDHGNWADLLGSGGSDFSKAEVTEIVAKRRRLGERGVQVSAGTEVVGFVDKILNDGKPRFSRRDLTAEDINEIISVHGKNIGGRGRAFVVASPAGGGFLDVEPHEIYQAYQRGMGDLTFGSGGLRRLMDERVPLVVEKSPRFRGVSYLYEIPGDKTHLLRVSVNSNRRGERYIPTLWVEPVLGFKGGRVEDLDVYNQRYWDSYRERMGLSPREYKLIPRYGERVQARRSGPGSSGRYKDGFVVAGGGSFEWVYNGPGLSFGFDIAAESGAKQCQECYLRGLGLA